MSGGSAAMALYTHLQDLLDLRVVGGCCGTDHEHITSIASALGLSDGTGRGPIEYHRLRESTNS